MARDISRLSDAALSELLAVRGILNCDDGVTEPMLARELDAYIARHLLGWKLAKVPPDANGENACEILTPDGKLPMVEIELPRVGKIGEAFLVCEYSRSLCHAMTLASQFGFKRILFSTCELSIHVPEKICRAVIKAVTARARCEAIARVAGEST